MGKMAVDDQSDRDGLRYDLFSLRKRYLVIARSGCNGFFPNFHILMHDKLNMQVQTFAILGNFYLADIATDVFI